MSAPIQLDGRFEDWPAAAKLIDDPSGETQGSGIDFTALWVANDEQRLFLRIDLANECHADEGHDVTLFFDTDRDPNTGRIESGVGAELVWNLGARSGMYHGRAGARALDLHALEILVAPTVSDSRFEIALPRDAIVSGNRIFAGPGFDLVISDDDGDRLRLPPPGYAFEPGSQPVTPIPLGRARPQDVRIAGYNVADDGLFQDPRRESLERIFRVVDPDVWVICEAWSHGALDLAGVIEEMLPSDPGEHWSALKLDAGNGIVTRLPILGSWLVLPESRLTAALLDLRPLHDCDLLVIANHWSCCDADENRQEQADALIAFIRDARTAGGTIDLAPGTPILAAGDFNLVGWRRQLTTLETGDIDDEFRYGTDSPPDWDGSGFDTIEARHPEAGLAHTWRDPESGFYPGRLDYMFHTGSVSIVDRAFVLDTSELSASTLALHGLRREDTGVASDHAPVVVDFRPIVKPTDAETTRVDSGEPVIRILSRGPDPFSSWTDLVYSLRDAGRVDIDVFDPRGRRVRKIASQWQQAGEHQVRWNAETSSGETAVAGRYLIRIRTDRGNVAAGVTLLR